MKYFLWFATILFSLGSLPLSASATPDGGLCETTPWPVLQETAGHGRRFQATPGGLVVEDLAGTNRQVFTACDGLPGTHITTVVPAHDRKVYVGVRGQGVVLFDPVSKAVESLAPKTVEIRWPTSLALLNNTLYVGTVQNGLWEVQLTEGTPVVRQPRWRFRKKRVSALAVQKNALLIARDHGGLWRWIPGQKEQRILKGSVQQVQVLPDGSIEVLRGIDRCIVGKRRRCTPVALPTAMPSLPPSGHLPSNHLTNLVVHPDATGTPRLWVGTFDRGVKVRKGTQWVRPIAEGTPPRFINQLLSAGSDLWAATPTGAFRLREGRWERFGENAGFLTNHVNAVHKTEDGRLVFGTSHGLTVWDEKGLKTYGEKDGLPDRIVYSVTSQGDTLIAGTLEGLSIRKDGKWEAFQTEDGSLADNWINAVSVDPKGNVFAGTYDAGIDRYTDGVFSHEPTRRPIWINPNGLVWSEAREHFFACTLGDGLWWQENGGQWRTFKTNNALPSNDVTDVISHEGWLWVATRSGLARIQLPEESSQTTG